VLCSLPTVYDEKASKNETDWLPKIMCIITGEAVREFF